MSKLAVIFPGIGYTADKPLLYYSRRIAADHGYEIRIMDYSGFPSKVKGDRKRMEESFSIALQQTEKMLSDTDLTAYEDILFIGKSIGTIVSAKMPPKVRRRTGYARSCTHRRKTRSASLSEKPLSIRETMIRGLEKTKVRFSESAASVIFRALYFPAPTILWKLRMCLQT